MTATPTSSVEALPLPVLSVGDSLRALGRLSRDPLGTMGALQAAHGDVVGLRAPRWVPGLPQLLVLVASPAGVRNVLTDGTAFVKGSPVYEEMAASLGDGLLTSDGERWQGQRRTLQPLFTPRAIDAYTDAFLDAIETVGAGWEERRQVDLADEMEKVTLGSVSRALFGTDATHEVAPIVAATDWVSAEVVRRGQSLWAPPRRWPTPRNRRLARLEEELRSRTARIVATAETTGADRDDLVARLHAASDPETGEGLEPGQVLEQALVFLLAGYDTTSTALATTLHLLGAHRDVQAAVREEIHTVVGTRTPTATDATDLELTRRALLEGMRLYPPAYVTSRTAARDVVVDGYAVPEGAVALTPFALLHRHRDHWHEPDRFDPDRFLPEAAAERDRYAYLPFGGGPRSCIGERFAMLEATLALAVLLRRFEVTTDGRRLPMRYGITQRSATPIRATLRTV
jgi:cytochrome P450